MFAVAFGKDKACDGFKPGLLVNLINRIPVDQLPLKIALITS